MKHIRTKKELVELAKELGVRADWHEPDEQEVDVVVEGSNFDNAGFWPSECGLVWKDNEGKKNILVEKHAIIRKDGQDVAAVNLATLLAFACGTYEG